MTKLIPSHHPREIPAHYPPVSCAVCGSHSALVWRDGTFSCRDGLHQVGSER